MSGNCLQRYFANAQRDKEQHAYSEQPRAVPLRTPDMHLRGQTPFLPHRLPHGSIQRFDITHHALLVCFTLPGPRPFQRVQQVHRHTEVGSNHLYQP